MNRDKIRGMFLGVAIGDALGMPVEMFSKKDIQEKYASLNGRIEKYHQPKHHKWFNGEAAGTTTDDTQLTVAVAEALIESGGFDMEAQQKYHISAYNQGTLGWGSSTRAAVKLLSEGVPWHQSGVLSSSSGKGNGVSIKIAPVAALTKCHNVIHDNIRNTSFVIRLAIMTHKTENATLSGMAQFEAIRYCLNHSPETFNKSSFSRELRNSCGVAELLLSQDKLTETLGIERETDDFMINRLKLLDHHQDFSYDRIIEEFGGGGGYCFDSVPFSLMFFIKNPYSIDSLYDIVSSGGDTDSNGSMLAACLGSLHGVSVFPKHLLEGLHNGQEMLNLANRFCDKFNVNE